MSKRAISLGILAIAGGVAALFAWYADIPKPTSAGVALRTDIGLTPAEERGREAFDARCATCHGSFGAGTDHGPPLIHVIYRPSHHPDQAFELAAKFGARAHHWKFGDMPPVPGITDSEIALIVPFVRAVQRANGIE